MNHRSKKTRKAFFGKILHFSLAVITSMTLLCGSEISVLAEPEETVEAQENQENQENQEAQQTAVSWPQGPEIFAETGVLIEASTGAVLYDKGCHQKMYPASITKIMTTMLALEVIHIHTLDITKLGKCDNGAGYRNQIFHADIELIESDGGTTIISILLSDFRNLITDNTQ